jgi:hypothetical protein
VHCDHEYLNFRGGKFSKSRGAFVDVPYFLSRYDPDPLRYYLTATAPETRDTPTAVLVGGFRRAPRDNNELVATRSLRFLRFPQDRQCMPGAREAWRTACYRLPTSALTARCPIRVRWTTRTGRSCPGWRPASRRWARCRRERLQVPSRPGRGHRPGPGS